MFARSRGNQEESDSAFGGTSGRMDDADATPPRSGRSNRGDMTAGRERTIHFQPEDRYWTDYLRIALPVIGLVIMLGLFWYWATAIIGNDDPNEPITTPPGQAQLNNVPVSSPTAQPDQNPAGDGGTEPAELSPADQTATAAAESGEQPAGEQPSTEQAGGDNQAADEEAADGQAGEIAIDSQVVVTESVKLRPEANTDLEEITILDEGVTLTVIGGPEEGEDFDWWEVVTEDGETGWVASDYIAPPD